MSRGSRYTPQDEALVAGLRASGLKHHEIATRTGIPRRSVSVILSRTPVAAVVTTQTREQVSSALWEVVAAGTAEALRRIHDPKTRAGELAQLLKVAAEQHQLITGQATANLAIHSDGLDDAEDLGEPLTEQERFELKAYLNQALAAYGSAEGDG